MLKSKEELLSTINESEISDELKISLMEDVSDSFVTPEPVDVELDEKYVELKSKYEELLERYKARFFEGSDEPESEPEKVEEKEEEKEVIDVKEI